ncbi:MAG: hypothetical protein ABEJ65_03090 [bacterium]
MTHPDQHRWDPKHRRRLDESVQPEPHSWIQSELSGEWTRIIDCASGISPMVPVLRERRDRLSSPCHYLPVDISPVALKFTRKQLNDLPVFVHPVQVDLMEHYCFREVRGLYVVTFFYSPELLATISKQAKAGSKVVSETYCTDPDSGDTPINPDYCLEPGELRSYFLDWKIIKYVERSSEHPETARIIARRP